VNGHLACLSVRLQIFSVHYVSCISINIVSYGLYVKYLMSPSGAVDLESPLRQTQDGIVFRWENACQFLCGLPENLTVVKQKCGASNRPRVSLVLPDTRSTASW